jgi:hypothetical protein
VNHSKPYTESEIQYLKDNYRSYGNVELAKHLFRSAPSVRQKLRTLNLKRTEAEILKLKKRPNSGQFKKGQKPGCTKYDGYERMTKDGYIEVRVSEGVFRLKHHINWEKANGEIPEGLKLRCIDGNKQNTDPQNWELTNNGEIIQRNANREKQSKTLKSKWNIAWRLNQMGIKRSWYTNTKLK